MKLTAAHLRRLIKETVEEVMSAVDEAEKVDQNKDGKNDFKDVQIARMKASGMSHDKAVKKVHEAAGGGTVADALTAAGLPVRPALRKLASQPISSVSLSFDRRPGEEGSYSASVTPNVSLGQKIPTPTKIALTADEHDAISDYRNAGASVGGGGAAGSMDLSGPDVAMKAGRKVHQIMLSGDPADLSSELQDAIAWLSKVPDTTKVDYSDANGMMLVAYAPGDDNNEIDNVTISWSPKPSTMARSFQKVVSFLKRNSKNFIKGDVD